MTERNREAALEAALQQLERQAEARWGADYVAENQDLLRLAAGYVVNIAANQPATETEPGFYQ